LGFIAASIGPRQRRSLIKIKETPLPLAAAQEQRGRLDQAEVDLPRQSESLIVKSAPSDAAPRGNLSVVCLDNGADNRKTHAHALQS